MMMLCTNLRGDEMNSDKFEKMCKEVIYSEQLSEQAKVQLIAIYAAEYRAYAERDMQLQLKCMSM
jgi:hypothetical protein